MNALTEFAAAGESRAARRLIRAALAEGWAISVSDGYETTVTRSTREKEILDAMCTTGEDCISIHLQSGKRGGVFWLIYGNADDGSELIADHSDNENCERLYAAVYPDA